MSKVSVIVPIYGVEKYIERCARSLFEQTLDDIEYIFVDDCSPDKSIEILNAVIADYPQKIPYIKIIQHKKNKGLPLARRSGWKAATGEYIANCDSDDWVDSALFEKMDKTAVDKTADIVVCDLKITDGITCNNTIKGLLSDNLSKEKAIKDMIYLRTTWSLCNKLICRKLYAELREYPKAYMGEDMAVMLPIFAACNTIAFCTNVYYYYFINASSASRQTTLSSTKDKYKGFIDNFEIVKRYCNLNEKNYILFHHKLMLIPFRKDREVCKWLNNRFTSIMLSVVMNKEIPKRDRLKAFVLLLEKLFKLI